MSHEDHPPHLPEGVAPVTPSLDIPQGERTPPPAAPPPTPRPAVSDDGVLRPIQESDYFTLDPVAIKVISANIDQYFEDRKSVV